MKFAVVCDTHMCPSPASPQRHYLDLFLEEIKREKPDFVLSLGDITSLGEKEAFFTYLDLFRDLKHYYVIGNSDVRTEATAEDMMALSPDVCFECEGVTFLGINTARDTISEGSREKIAALRDGDVLFMHHYIESLDEDSRAFLVEKMENTALTVLQGHKHDGIDRAWGRSRAIRLRAADPDKSIGGYPCITFFTLDESGLSYEEFLVKTPVAVLSDVEKYFGVSCVDNRADVTYALEKGIAAVELRCNGADWHADYDLVPILEQWKKKTNGYLSVHMPNLRYRDGKITGGEQWDEALKYAKDIGADGITMHPPRAPLGMMVEGSPLWNEYLSYYVRVVETLPDGVALGVENMHMEITEEYDETRGFGYLPPEVASWIDAINEAVGKTTRVGHLLDVGHARSNGLYSQSYPVGRWYEHMGKRTVAYHIHQIVGGNHHAIEAWLAPVINYSSFFYAWESGMLNHKPIFLEVKGWQNHQKSIEAFQKLKEE